MLNKTQAAVIRLLADSSLRDRFYWSGGTLLSEKYLHHRKSYDIDLFANESFRYQEVLPLVARLRDQLNLRQIEEHKIFDRWEFFLHNHEEVRLEFVHYDFPALKPRKRWRGVLIDSLEDLAANKTMAAIERHEPKDVVDVYYLVTKRKMSLPKLLKLVNKKFGLKIDESTLLSELLHGSSRLNEIKAMLLGKSTQREKKLTQIKDYFQNLSAELLRQRWK